MFWLLFALDVGFFFDSRTLFAFLLFVHYCSLLFLEKITIKFFSFLVFTGKIILVGRMKKLQKMLKRIKSTSLASKKIIFFFFEENYTKKMFFSFSILNYFFEFNNTFSIYLSNLWNNWGGWNTRPGDTSPQSTFIFLPQHPDENYPLCLPWQKLLPLDWVVQHPQGLPQRTR